MTNTVLAESVTTNPLDKTDRRSAGHYALLALILLAALGLRLRGISTVSFWYDESATVKIVQTEWSNVFPSIATYENTPPLHYLLLKVWSGVAGVSEWSMRLPSVLLGVFSIWMTYRLCAYCIGPNEGLIAAALMTVSRYHIWYSQEARSYMLMVALAVWSCDEFVRMLDEPPKWHRELRYWLATMLLLYSHLYGVFAVAAQFVHYLLRLVFGRKTQIVPLKMLQLQLAIWIPFGMWAEVIRKWYFSRAGSFWILPLTPSEIVATYWVFINNANLPLALVFGALLVLGCTRPRIRPWLALLLPLLLLPVVVPVILSILTHPLYMPRYGLIAIVPLFILVAAGIGRLHRIPRLLTTAAVAALMIAAPAHQLKADWRSIAAYLTENAQTNDQIMVNAKDEVVALRLYFNRPDVRTYGFWGTAIPLGLPLRYDTEHVWLVLARPDPPNGGIIPIELGHFRVCSQKQFGEVMVYELADGAVEAQYAYPDDIRFNAKPPTKDRTRPASFPAQPKDE